jgi:hypothetical protein
MMSEPTIDEMIKWLRELPHYIKPTSPISSVLTVSVDDINMAQAIIAILEQHREHEAEVSEGEY